MKQPGSEALRGHILELYASIDNAKNCMGPQENTVTLSKHFRNTTGLTMNYTIQSAILL